MITAALYSTSIPGSLQRTTHAQTAEVLATGHGVGLKVMTRPVFVPNNKFEENLFLQRLDKCGIQWLNGGKVTNESGDPKIYYFNPKYPDDPEKHMITWGTPGDLTERNTGIRVVSLAEVWDLDKLVAEVEATVHE